MSQLFSQDPNLLLKARLQKKEKLPNKLKKINKSGA